MGERLSSFPNCSQKTKEEEGGGIQVQETAAAFPLLRCSLLSSSSKMFCLAADPPPSFTYVRLLSAPPFPRGASNSYYAIASISLIRRSDSSGGGRGGEKECCFFAFPPDPAFWNRLRLGWLIFWGWRRRRRRKRGNVSCFSGFQQDALPSPPFLSPPLPPEKWADFSEEAIKSSFAARARAKKKR